MNEKRGGGNPNWGLLLLVPAAVLLAKGAMHRHAMWESGWGPAAEVGGHGYGHHGHLGGAAEPGGQATFRLPPRIEEMLDSWHTRAHQAAEASEPPTA